MTETARQLIQIAIQAIGPSRSETLMGKDYTVLPAVLVRSQVLHNNIGRSLLPVEEFTDTWAQQWNGIPVVAGDHPSKRGISVSARTPDILNEVGVGVIFNARVVTSGQQAELKAEVWLDHSRVEDVEELQNILDMLEGDLIVELSTGFMAWVEEETGVFNGREYDLVMHPIGADHLAIFSEATGACSVQDGCGLGANQDKGDPVDPEKQPAEGEPQVTTQVEGGEPPADDGEAPSWFRGFMQRFRAAIGFDSVVDNGLSDDEKHRVIWRGLQERFGGPGKDVWIESVFSDDGNVVFAIWTQTEGSGLWQVDFTLSEEGEDVEFGEAMEVRRRTVYEPVSNSEADNSEEDVMNRKELIAHLAEELDMEEAALQKFSDCQLKALHSADGGDGTGEGTPSGSEGGAPATDPAPTSDPPSGGGSPEPAAQQGAEVTASLEAVNKSLTALRAEIGTLRSTQEEHSQALQQMSEVTAPALQEQTQERASLLDSLASNERVPWTREELDPKSLDELRRLDSLARGRNYVGRGGPKVAAQSERGSGFLAPSPHFAEPAGVGAEGEG